MSSMYVLLWTTLKLAVRQLLRHRVRSVLTMLGIFIGVGSVVAIVSLGEGLRGFFMSAIASAATDDLVYVMPDVPMRAGQVPNIERPFKNRDLEMVRSSEYVTTAIGGHVVSSITIKHGWRSENVMCSIAPHEYFPMDGWQLERGRYFTSAEERGRALVVVVGGGIHDLLYDEHEVLLGSSLTIGSTRFTVIGELKSRSALEGGNDANRMVFIPLETGQDRLLGSDDLFWIGAKVRSSKELIEAKEDIAARLRASRRIRSGADDDFQISTPDDWAAFANTFVSTLIMVFGVVAVIALVVGGIGVMNVMLVNVRERTREIGLRKALGATAAQITWQFLVESSTMTLIGGLLGLCLGYGLGFAVALLMKSLWDVFWMPHVPTVWILAVMATSGGLGLLFGVYPAWRAGMMDPINALRYE